MSIMFWALVIILSMAAVGFVAVPLRACGLTPGKPATVAIAVIPLTALSLYFVLGSPGLIAAEAGQAHAAPAEHQSTRSTGSVDSLVDGLSARLQREPDDAGGWLLLARSYDLLGRDAEAIAAYERAKALGKTDAVFEASLLVATPAATEQITRPGLHGRIELAPDVVAQIEPGDSVFIFAKESVDHRMPIVALRKPATDLPFDFVLTDKEAMAPGTRLDAFDSLVVTARISKTGNAMDNSLGLDAWSDPVSPVNGGSIDLVIGNE